MTVSENVGLDGAAERVGCVDLTPTWAGVLPLLLAAYADGTAEGRRAAEQELRRMAQLADAQVAARTVAKSLEPKGDKE